MDQSQSRLLSTVKTPMLTFNPTFSCHNKLFFGKLKLPLTLITIKTTKNNLFQKCFTSFFLQLFYCFKHQDDDATFLRPTFVRPTFVRPTFVRPDVCSTPTQVRPPFCPTYTQNASFVRPILKIRHLSDPPFVRPVHEMRHLSDLYKMRHLSDPSFVRPVHKMRHLSDQATFELKLQQKLSTFRRKKERMLYVE